MYLKKNQWRNKSRKKKTQFKGEKRSKIKWNTTLKRMMDFRNLLGKANLKEKDNFPSSSDLNQSSLGNPITYKTMTPSFTTKHLRSKPRSRKVLLFSMLIPVWELLPLKVNFRNQRVKYGLYKEAILHSRIEKSFPSSNLVFDYPCRCICLLSTYNVTRKMVMSPQLKCML